ncbi:MAG: hypothetical protein M1814_006918 [Vezdaea aestivalis]|nr:MAG: hypothetical protein M1814_006918 [Vezdaea aestivalis]
MVRPQSLVTRGRSPARPRILSIDTEKLDHPHREAEPEYLSPIFARGLQRVGFESPVADEAHAAESAEIKRRVLVAMRKQYQCENEDPIKREAHDSCDTDSSYEADDTDANEAFDKVRDRSPIPIFGKHGEVVGEETFDGVRCGGAIVSDLPVHQLAQHSQLNDTSSTATCGSGTTRGSSNDTLQPSRIRPSSYVETELEETFEEMSATMTAFAAKINRLLRSQEVQHLNHIGDSHKVEEGLDSIKECVFALVDGQTMMFERINDLEQSLVKLVHSLAKGTEKDSRALEEKKENGGVAQFS